VIESVVSALPRQPCEPDLLEEVIDPLYALSGDTGFVSGGELVPLHVGFSDSGPLPLVQIRPLSVRYLSLHRFVDRVQNVAERDGGQRRG